MGETRQFVTGAQHGGITQSLRSRRLRCRTGSAKADVRDKQDYHTHARRSRRKPSTLTTS